MNWLYAYLLVSKLETDPLNCGRRTNPISKLERRSCIEFSHFCASLDMGGRKGSNLKVSSPVYSGGFSQAVIIACVNCGRGRSPEFLVVPEVFLLVEEVCSRRTQIYDLRASIAVFFKASAFEAVEGIRDTLEHDLSARISGDTFRAKTHFTTTYDTLILVITERTFVAYAN